VRIPAAVLDQHTETATINEKGETADTETQGQWFTMIWLGRPYWTRMGWATKIHNMAYLDGRFRIENAKAYHFYS
jgi:hypothetical protein